MKVIFYSLALLLTLMTGFAIGQSPAQDSDAKILSTPDYVMSEGAEKAGIDGTIVLAVSVDKSGNVKSADVIAGPAWPCSGNEPKKEIEEVRKGIKQSVLKMKFSPAYKNGKPVSKDLQIEFMVGEAYQSKLRRLEVEEAKKNGKLPPGTINAGILNGMALKLPPPGMPGAAHAVHASGTVKVQVLIDENGKVIRAGILSGNPYLQHESRLAACMAEFSPTLIQGRPMRVNGMITYIFQL